MNTPWPALPTSQSPSRVHSYGPAIAIAITDPLPRGSVNPIPFPYFRARVVPWEFAAMPNTLSPPQYFGVILRVCFAVVTSQNVTVFTICLVALYLKLAAISLRDGSQLIPVN